jgi:type III secretory pathway component EscR
MTGDKLDVKTKEISKLRNEIRDMFLEYMNKISDNKFRNFLSRIFKKKYKELKKENGKNINKFLF